MRIFLFVLVAAAPCFAQNTWGGLRFGMTPAQARLALKDRPNKSRTEPANAELHTPAIFFIDVQGVTVAQHQGTAHLRFDSGQKLAQVSLDFSRMDGASGGCFKGISNEEAAKRSVIITDVSEKILERFGKPVSETGTFPTTHQLASFYAHGGDTGVANITGKPPWRTEGQVIEEMLQLPCGSLFLFVSYRPQTKDEL